jgi:hypothetical protein
MANIIAALISGFIIIVLSVVGATWHLSDKIGDLRVSIASLNEKEACGNSKVEMIWNRCFGPRPCRVPTEPAKQ